jgi:hypothetical protein
MNPSYPEHEQLGYNANFQIALSLPFKKLKIYCVSSDLFRSICSNQEFWRIRLQNDFSNAVQYKPNDMTYGQYYTALVEKRIKSIQVTYNDKYIGYIPMFPTDLSDNDLYKRSIGLLYSKNINFDINKVELYALLYSGKHGLYTLKLINQPSYERSINGPPYDFWKDLYMIDIEEE